MAITTNFTETVLELVTDITSAETATLSNAYFQKFFEVGVMPDNYTLITGVRKGNVIPIISTNPSYAKFPYKDPTNCTLPACDLDLPYEAKAWQLGMIACKTSVCINTFDDNFLAFWGRYKRLFGDEDLNSALMAYIMQNWERDLQAALWRMVWFGDTTIGSGEENYTLLRAIDGIFTQAEAGDGIKIEVTENPAGTGLTGAAVYAYLLEAYEAASVLPWFDPATMRFEMTSAMAAVFVAWLNSLGDRSMYNCDCFTADGVTSLRSFTLDGRLTAFGIPIYVRREFDGVINQLDLGNPYRALLTTNDNIIIGTSELDQLPAFSIHYSQDDDLIYIKGGAQIGVALVTNDYVYIGAESANPSV
jgi:hypothetical protein